MGSFNRALKRKQAVKKKKALKKGLDHVMKAASGMPTSCTLCDLKFDDTAELDKWYMKMSDSHIVLTCPQCSENINK